MDKIPNGFKLVKVDEIPSDVKARVYVPGKWTWLRQRLQKMTEGEISSLICPNKREAELAQTAIKNFSKRNQEFTPPVLRVDFNTYKAPIEGSDKYEIYIECVKLELSNG